MSTDAEQNQAGTAWVTFCISTFKRRELLKEQLLRLQQQTDSRFEVVVSDNDPDGSAREVVENFNDERFRYFKNEENLGMIPSFNLSVERARTEFVVMVTDDDPVVENFLAEIFVLVNQYPGKSVYGGFIRKNVKGGEVETIDSNLFISEIIDPAQTPVLLWSSCVLRRADAIRAGLIPVFGSPHLADHAFIALTGQYNGGVAVNKMFSHVTMHDSNFSKFNFDYYYRGCEGFYKLLRSVGNSAEEKRRNKKAALGYLHKWFIDCFFNLKKYYSVNRDAGKLKEVEDCAQKILQLDYMRSLRFKYEAKKLILAIKLKLGVVKAS